MTGTPIKQGKLGIDTHTQEKLTKNTGGRWLATVHRERSKTHNSPKTYRGSSAIFHLGLVFLT